MIDSMIVIYLKSNQTVLFWSNCENLVITEDSISTKDLIMAGVNFDEVGYGLYAFKDIAVRDEPYTLAELDLQPITAGNLPQSTHIAALISIDGTNNKADVARVLYGETYLVEDCWVTQSAVDLYIDGKITVYNPAYPPDHSINADSFVVMDYITETPISVEITLPTLTDKFLLASSSISGIGSAWYTDGKAHDLQLMSAESRSYFDGTVNKEAGYSMATTDLLIITLLFITLIMLAGHKLKRLIKWVD